MLAVISTSTSLGVKSTGRQHALTRQERGDVALDAIDRVAIVVLGRVGPGDVARPRQQRPGRGPGGPPVDRGVVVRWQRADDPRRDDAEERASGGHEGTFQPAAPAGGSRWSAIGERRVEMTREAKVEAGASE
ncbi:MAG: hypothetical protein IPH44_43405 [Myxococcales bacterium]|nr:hypothetical protein [Myxococcales bacterium]